MAKAEEDKVYVQIVGGKCHWVFTADELPEWNDDDIQVVEVTGNVPAPGDVYENGGFVAPAPDPVQQRTIFTSLEFLDRFTSAEQLAVVAATMQSAPVKLWYDRLLAASYVDLSDPRTEEGVDALIAAGLIDPSRKAALLQPGGA